MSRAPGRSILTKEVRAMGRKKWKTALLIVLLIFIWGNSMLSKEASGVLSGALMQKMNTAARWLGLGEDLFTVMVDEDGDGVEEPSSYLVRKIAHVSEFAVLSILLWSIYEQKGVRRGLWAFGTAAACAAADETIQLFSHRGSQILDVLIDAAGALLGLGIVRLLHMSKAKQTDRT